MEQQQSPPIANANPDQVVNEGHRVTLTGTASFNSVGEIILIRVD
jgi:hypothetical protein